jgi:hypothetical protein
MITLLITQSCFDNQSTMEYTPQWKFGHCSVWKATSEGMSLTIKLYTS